MPCSVDIAVTSPTGAGGSVGCRRPLDDASSRTFWCIGRTDDLAGDDRDHLTFQDRVLAATAVTATVTAEGGRW